RLAELRARPALPLELPGDEVHVRRESQGVRAVIGVGRGVAMELDVRVEGRPFTKLVRTGELPVAAVVDVSLDRLGEALAAMYINPKHRAALAAAEAFPTLQGPRASLARAARDGVISTASWEGEWL